MSARNLLLEPVWQAEELGRPIPASLHAVSVALPRWQDVTGYEEQRPEVMAKLSSGYPRFVIHPLVRALSDRLGRGAPCLVFPSAQTAEHCQHFIQNSAKTSAEVVAKEGLYGVRTTAEGSAGLKAFWQHTGLVVSSRQAEAHLAGRPDTAEAPAIRRHLRQQLAQWYDCAVQDVLLAPSGMAAQWAALRIINHWRPGRPTAQLGFPYVDTLKLQQKLGHGGWLLHDLKRMKTALVQLLARQPMAACFCEIPGNPLLGSADARQLTPLLRQQGIPLIADDVVATPLNVDLRPHADLIATSLTKYIVGSGDAMGGALVCNPRSPYYRQLQPVAQALHEELLWGEEAAILDAHAQTFPNRMRQHNANGLLLAERLRQHPQVERVWYPKWEFPQAYEAVRRPDGGWGALVTFLPKQAETYAPRLYDALAISKGPSLGTSFSLACPFTLLAHYTELDWAESCGVSRFLIRLSVGLEEPAELWQRLERAFTAAYGH